MISIFYRQAVAAEAVFRLELYSITMRPEILNPLFAETASLKGVGTALSRPLKRLGLERVVDIIFHLPVTTIERKTVSWLNPADAGRIINIMLTPTDYRSGGARSPFRVHAVDASGEGISLVYFGKAQGWARKLLPIGKPRLVSGKLETYGEQLQMVHPDHVLEPDDKTELNEKEPVYGLSEGLTNRRMGGLAHQALERLPDLPEWVEPGLLQQRGWPGWQEALRRAHADPADSLAKARLAYDEVFANQLALMLVRASTRRRRGVSLQGTGRLIDKLNLPYRPTNAQQRSVNEITGDMAQSSPMLRLLQGDVGSGKTLVALMALLTAVEAGTQGAMLAPTEILARQHLQTLTEMTAGLPIEIAILTGREKGRVRTAILERLAAGEIDILVGTHAIFQAGVHYHNLGLAVVDEQHRFGVSQRLMLTEKAARPPHMLVMTATPIPRTLTLTHYGEMDVSRLDEMPPGRQPVETRVMSVERLDEIVAGLGRHVGAGGQAYWVCPLVEESENNDQAAAEARGEMLQQLFGSRVGVVHGRMKGPEKDAVMAAFQSGELSVLVATTVIEVGVNVPNATLMIIEGAERFGLAQLHQLRGRVGRGEGRSICLLLRGPTLSETARARLALMRETNDGFLIAEEDLRLRGAGEILGTVWGTI